MVKTYLALESSLDELTTYQEDYKEVVGELPIEVLKKSDVETFIKNFIKTLKEFSEEYEYYYDEEDTIVEVSLDNKTDKELREHGIEEWSNERMVVPIEVIEKEISKIFKTKLLKGEG